MVIGFKKQFVDLIMQGSKVHTIRDDKGNRWRAGMAMHMYTGGRFSKEYRQFAEKQCTSVQEINMWLDEDDNGLSILHVFVESDSQAAFDYEQFAIRDGFSSMKAFYDYWMPIIEELPGERFTGKIIHWTDLKY